MIPGNAQEESWGMVKRIPEDAQKDLGECSRRFPGMFMKNI